MRNGYEEQLDQIQRRALRGILAVVAGHVAFTVWAALHWHTAGPFIFCVYDVLALIGVVHVRRDIARSRKRFKNTAA